MSASRAAAAPHAPAPAVRWQRLIPVVLCASYLWLVFCLALWVVGPLVGFRWQPVLIGADSMEPAIRAGDVVLIDRLGRADLASGDVITYQDPVWPDELVTHRIVELLDGERYRTKGDASAVEDSTPIPRADVLGVGRLLVPLVGLPFVWLRQAPAVAAAWSLVTVTAWVVASRLSQLTASATAPAVVRRRVATGRLAVAAARWGGPRPIAGPLRRWSPPLLVAMASVALAGVLGVLALVPPLGILLLDPRGPHLPVGRWQRRWRTGRVTRLLRPLPVSGTLTTVVAVAVTLLSTATFTAASPNPTNSFGAAALAPASDLSAIVTCTDGTPTVELTWTASPSARIEGYLLDRDGTPLGPLAATATSFSDTGAGNDTPHTWTIRASVGSWTSTPVSTSATPSCATAPPSSGVVASGADGSYDFVVPSSTLPGDLLLAYIAATNGDEGFPAPTGWTLRRHHDFVGTHVWLFFRVADATDAGTTYTFTKPQAIGAGTLLVYSGIDPASPFVDGTAATYASTTDLLATSAVAEEAASTAVALYTLDAATTIAPPAGMSTRVLGSVDARTILAADEVLATAGATGDRTAVSDAPGTGLSILEVLRPAPAAFAAVRSAGPIGSNGRLDEAALTPIGGGHLLEPSAAAAFAAMRAAALADLGIDLVDRITDSYRTYAEQVAVAGEKGLYAQGGLAAAPGTSRHGLGLALDLDVGGPVGAWLHAHAARFGYGTIPREPWHWEYGG